LGIVRRNQTTSVAFGVPVVALFGPTLPEVTGPLGDEHRVIQASRPAMHRAYRQPGAERHTLEITEPMVIEALDAMLL
jgi:ADP-heptose:LPS heptosyltransferase